MLAEKSSVVIHNTLNFILAVPCITSFFLRLWIYTGEIERLGEENAVIRTTVLNV